MKSDIFNIENPHYKKKVKIMNSKFWDEIIIQIIEIIWQNMYIMR